MRLLNANTLEMKEYYEQIPPYAILSHTWGEEEVTFQDFQSRSDREKKKGFTKITNCCLQAQRYSIEWVWIGTCCIDKTSSAELSEAIDSMYAWYRDSQVCYAFLEDVLAGNLKQTQREFAFARWFTRWWCLQELIAPLRIEFYGRDWVEIGTKYSLRYEIQRITKIPLEVLVYWNLKHSSSTIAQKMSWASERKTTRIEDQAYCLLGIFGVHMPLLYGEGRAAFRRLQEEIIKQTEDDSIFLWTDHTPERLRGSYDMDVLASSPRFFRSQRIELLDTLGDGVEYGSYSEFTLAGQFRELAPISGEPPRITSRGLQVEMPVTAVPWKTNPWIIWKGGETAGLRFLWTRCVYQGRLVGILLDKDIAARNGELYARSGDGVQKLYLLGYTDASNWTRLRTSQARIYLRVLSPDWGWHTTQVYFDLASPAPEIVLLPSTENRVKVLKASNDTADIAFAAETITEGPRKGETQLRAAGITKALAAGRGLQENTDIQHSRTSLEEISPPSVQRLEMLVLAGQIPIWQGPSASNPLGISLLVRQMAGVDGYFKDPECNLCFTVSEQGFKNWEGTCYKDQLILPNGLTLTAAAKWYRGGPTKPGRLSIHIGLHRAAVV